MIVPAAQKATAMSKRYGPLALLAVLTANAGPTAGGPARTVVGDRLALQRLRGNEGIATQWISWEPAQRGSVTVSERGGLVHLRGVQALPGRGRLELDGDVLRIEARRFVFKGRIVLTDAPDRGRRCVRDGTYDFRITQQRRYWRLRQMEQCDGLTDYVDIYF